MAHQNMMCMTVLYPHCTVWFRSEPFATWIGVTLIYLLERATYHMTIWLANIKLM